MNCPPHPVGSPPFHSHATTTIPSSRLSAPAPLLASSDPLYPVSCKCRHPPPSSPILPNAEPNAPAHRLPARTRTSASAPGPKHPPFPLCIAAPQCPEAVWRVVVLSRAPSLLCVSLQHTAHRCSSHGLRLTSHLWRVVHGCTRVWCGDARVWAGAFVRHLFYPSCTETLDLHAWRPHQAGSLPQRLPLAVCFDCSPPPPCIALARWPGCIVIWPTPG